MAEMNLPQKGGRRKVQAPRIDLTPMVDLGFLLITFFMFTTTLAQPKALVMNMPTTERPQVPTVFPEESTITLIPVNDHKVRFYEGAWTKDLAIKTCTIKELIIIVLGKCKAAAALPAEYSVEAHKLHVLIKPADNCKYEDVIQVMDVMLIANVPYYAMVDITDEEIAEIGME